MTAKIKLNAASGGGSVSLEAPTSTTGNANVEFKLPVADGTNGQVIKTNGSGVLSFGADSGGKILQVVIAQTDTQASTSSSTFAEITTDLRATIVPTSATSKIIVDVSLYLSSNSQTAGIRILKDGSTMVSGAGTSQTYDGDGTLYYAANWMGTFNRFVFETAGNTNSRYYTPFWARNSGTAYLNRYQSSATYLGTSSIRVMEVAA